MRIVQRSSGEGRGSEATDLAKRGPSEARPEQIIAEAEERGADATSVYAYIILTTSTSSSQMVGEDS